MHGERTRSRGGSRVGMAVSASLLLAISSAFVGGAPLAQAEPPRVFEQVTPAGSTDFGFVSPQASTEFTPGGKATVGLVGAFLFSSTDGDQVVYMSPGDIAGAQAQGFELFRASRGPSGWSSSWASPHEGDPFLLTLFMDASDDASTVVFSPMSTPHGEGVSLDPADPTESGPYAPSDLYEQSGPTSSAWVSRGPQSPASEESGVAGGDIFDGLSADGSTLVWESTEAIMPGQPDLGHINVYARTGGVTRRVSVASDGTSPETGDSSILRGHGPSIRGQHAVSLDGSRIFFLSREKLAPEAPSDGSLSLYLRSGSQTILVAAGSVGYEDATPDGSHVYYTLTSLETGAQELYDYDVATATSSPVAVDQATGEVSSDPNQTVGYVTSSADGSHVYFVSKAPLDPADQGPAQQNYGLFERVGGATGKTRFIASLNELVQFRGCEGFYNGGTGCPPAVYSARASADGSRLFFTTATHLTPDAQRPATDAQGKPLYDVYVYDDATHQITRVSQGPSGGEGPYSATMGILPFGEVGSTEKNNGVDPRDISADGSRVFFSTREKLTPDAADNGKLKVYEWENGTTTLVSPSDAGGDSPADAVYANNSESGDDVFFSTTDSLSCSDTDGGRPSIYDARIGGTAATCPAPPSPCQATNTCAAVAPEPTLTPASSLFSGPGDQPVIVNRLTAVKTTPPTRAQKLAKALKACRKKPHKQRRACESQAKKTYGTKFKTKQSSSHPGHASRRAAR
jgi:hypothetical protein